MRTCTPLRIILQNASFMGQAYMEEISSQKKLAGFRVGLVALMEATNKLLLSLDLNDGAHQASWGRSAGLQSSEGGPYVRTVEHCASSWTV